MSKRIILFLGIILGSCSTPKKKDSEQQTTPKHEHVEFNSCSASLDGTTVCWEADKAKVSSNKELFAECSNLGGTVLDKGCPSEYSEGCLFGQTTASWVCRTYRKDWLENNTNLQQLKQKCQAEGGDWTFEL